MDLLVWSLTNVVANLVLPPTAFLVSIAIGIWQWRKAWGRWLAILSLAVFALISVPAVSYLLVRPFESAWPPLDLSKDQANWPKDAVVVVLGGGRFLGALEYPGSETLSDASLSRSRYGAAVAARYGLPMAVSGGKPDGGQRSEAELMKDFIEKELKQPVAFIEDKSSDTRQNALYAAEKLEGLKVRTILLVTDVWHMPRARRAFEAAGLKVIAAPMGFRSSAPLRAPDFLPSLEGLRLSEHVLHELVGAIWYAVRG
jgi:uncharacterized SAM-binding protein YcdF (DUF218 family)